jgi:signal transduction histidine kinase
MYLAVFEMTSDQRYSLGEIMYTDTIRYLKEPLIRHEPENAEQKPRIQLCGHKSDCAKMKAAWCASQTKMRVMANHLLTVQEDERKRIASDLHDGLGQSLNMIKFTLSEAENLLANGMVDDLTEALSRLKRRIHGVIDEVRHAAMDLRPPMLDDLGILPTLSWHFRELETACPNIKAKKDFDIKERDIPEQLKITIYRIVQEASNNIIKHSGADLLTVCLKRDTDALHLLIEDNGGGFDPASVIIRNGSDRGLGLLSMKERAALSGGIYEMKSAEGSGTKIQVSWKYDFATE